MGVDFYVVVPDLRIRIYVGRRVSEENSEKCMEKLNKVIDNNADGKYEVNVASVNYKDIKARDVARLITFYEDASYLLEERLIDHVVVHELLRIFPDSKLVADCSEEYGKYAGYAEYPKE